jgi:hypothetical protein
VFTIGFILRIAVILNQPGLGVASAPFIISSLATMSVQGGPSNVLVAISHPNKVQGPGLPYSSAAHIHLHTPHLVGDSLRFPQHSDSLGAAHVHDDRHRGCSNRCRHDWPAWVRAVHQARPAASRVHQLRHGGARVGVVCFPRHALHVHQPLLVHGAACPSGQFAARAGAERVRVLVGGMCCAIQSSFLPPAPGTTKC